MNIIKIIGFVNEPSFVTNFCYFVDWFQFIGNYFQWEMGLRVTGCCCCFNLEIGATLIGTFVTVIGICCIISSAIEYDGELFTGNISIVGGGKIISYLEFKKLLKFVVFF